MGQSILGFAATALGQAGSAMSQADQYKYQAAIAKQNQEYSLMQGEQSAAQSGMASRFRIGQIKTAEGASGFSVGQGTMPDVVKGQQLIAQTEQTQIRSNAAEKAYNYDMQAQGYSMAAKNTMSALPLEIFSTVLGTASSTASKWMQYGQAFGSSPGFDASGNPLSSSSPSASSWAGGF